MYKNIPLISLIKKKYENLHIYDFDIKKKNMI